MSDPGQVVGQMVGGPIDSFNRSADRMVMTLVLQIHKTTVWVDLEAIVDAIGHIRIQQEQHNAEMRHHFGAALGTGVAALGTPAPEEQS